MNYTDELPCYLFDIKKVPYSDSPLSILENAFQKFWEERETRLKQYPHKCPRCGGLAYIGLSEVDHYDKSKDCK